MSSTFFAFILPFSIAFRMESMSVDVVFENGISRMTIVFWSSFSIFARTFTVPPRCPSLYFATSIEPPVGKSG